MAKKKQEVSISEEIQDGRLIARNAVMDKINKGLGAGTIVRLGDAKPLNINRLPTGLLGLDYVLGGGWPEGRICILWGWESSGKSLICNLTLAANKNLNAAYVDAENGFDEEFSKKLDVPTENLTYVQTGDGESAIDVIVEMLRSGAWDIIIIDSIAQLVPSDELVSSMAQQSRALQARMINKAFRKIIAANIHNTTILAINQLRENMQGGKVPPGGRGQKFAASVIVEVIRGEQMYVDNDWRKPALAYQIKYKAVKNKVAPPFRMSESWFEYGPCQISRRDEVIRLGELAGLLPSKGGYYYLDGQTLHGAKALADYVRSTPGKIDQMEKDIRTWIDGQRELKPSTLDPDPTVKIGDGIAEELRAEAISNLTGESTQSSTPASDEEVPTNPFVDGK